ADLGRRVHHEAAPTGSLLSRSRREVEEHPPNELIGRRARAKARLKLVEEVVGVRLYARQKQPTLVSEDGIERALRHLRRSTQVLEGSPAISARPEQIECAPQRLSHVVLNRSSDRHADTNRTDQSKCQPPSSPRAETKSPRSS